MKLFSWKKQRSRSTRSESAPSPAKPQPHPRRARKAPPRKVVPLEIKRRALEALEAGLTAAEVGTLAGVSATAVERWRKLHQAGGEAALQGTARDPGTRKICAALEERITQLRREKPQAGVRKIRDALRREEGLAVSAETVRRVVNEAGLGNPPEPSPRRPPQVRRFERELPNALWQIDIFTFKLKRMYPVYLVGMIDDHSRYLVGHGLYRQQTAEAVLEVVKGAIGQWGAPREILSDNGRQFAAWRGQTPFQKVLQRQGIQHVRSAPHHSEDPLDRIPRGRPFRLVRRRAAAPRPLGRVLQSPAAAPGARRAHAGGAVLRRGRGRGRSPQARLPGQRPPAGPGPGAPAAAVPSW